MAKTPPVLSVIPLSIAHAYASTLKSLLGVGKERWGSRRDLFLNHFLSLALLQIVVPIDITSSISDSFVGGSCASEVFTYLF